VRRGSRAWKVQHRASRHIGRESASLRLSAERDPLPHNDNAQILRDAITDLTERFAYPTTIEDTLATVTAAVLHLLPVVDSADVLIITEPGEHRSVAATSPLATDLDRVQQRHGQGPCLDAAVGETMVVCNDLRHDGRWPGYAESALEAGVHATVSFQLYTHQHRPTQRAALNLVSRLPDAFDPEAQAVAAMLATHAAITLIAQDREAQFHSALASRDTIGQAKGMIMERFDIDAQSAFELLKKLSQDANKRLVDIAAQIVAGGSGR